MRENQANTYRPEPQKQQYQERPPVYSEPSRDSDVSYTDNISEVVQEPAPRKRRTPKTNLDEQFVEVPYNVCKLNEILSCSSIL
jgi:hypothetical protein